MKTNITSSHISRLAIFLLKVLPVSNVLQLQIVEQTPELLEIVLKGGACEKQSVVRVNIGENFVQQRFLVLESVSFIHHNVGPNDVLKEFLVLPHHFIAGDQNIEAQVSSVILTFILSDDLSGLGISQVSDGVHVRRPLTKLILPSCNGGQGHTHQHRALKVIVVEEVL